MTVTIDSLLDAYISLFEVGTVPLTLGADLTINDELSVSDVSNTVTSEEFENDNVSLADIETSGTGSSFADLQSISQFQVIGHTIYDPNGQEFIAKGINVFTWDGTQRIDNYMDTWGFNTVRVPNYLLGTYGQPHPEDNDYYTNRKIVNEYTARGATVIFSAHDKIGSYYEGADFAALKSYWRRMAQEFKDNPYVWFNLHNEPGNKTPQYEKWVTYHRELIDIIRAEGANNTIVIDGETWGQDYKTRTIQNRAGDVMAGNNNIVFSMHVYKQWGDGSDVGGYIDELHAQNIPILVGEYGNTASSANMMSALQEREVGRIAWVAMAADHHDLTTGDKGHAWHFTGENSGILTDLGRLILDDLQRPESLDQLTVAPASSDDLENQLLLDTDGAIASASRIERIKHQAQRILLGDELRVDQVDLNLTDRTVWVEGGYVTTLKQTDDAILGLHDHVDAIYGQDGHDVLSGRGGDDSLFGERGKDFLIGDQGNDILDGGRNRDFLYGGAGTDYLIGGKGRDRFLLDDDGSVDTIADFRSTVDTILLGRGMTPDLISFRQGHDSQFPHTLILDEQEQIFGILENVHVSKISASDFQAL